MKTREGIETIFVLYDTRIHTFAFFIEITPKEQDHSAVVQVRFGALWEHRRNTLWVLEEERLMLLIIAVGDMRIAVSSKEPPEK